MNKPCKTGKQSISLYVKNALAEGKLPAVVTVKDYLTVQTKGFWQVPSKKGLVR